MLSVGIRKQPYTVIPTLLGSNFGFRGHMWSQNDVITSWLRLIATSNCFLHPYLTYTNCLSTLICCLLAYGTIFTQLYTLLAQISTGSDFGVLGCIWSQNIVIMSWLRLIATSNCFLHPTNTYAKCFSISIDLRSIGIQEQFYTVIHTNPCSPRSKSLSLNME